MIALKAGGYTLAALLLLALVFTIGNMTVYAILAHAPQENAQRVERTVKAICDYSRDVHSMQAEEQCGIAQDESQTEYLCKAVTAPIMTCWVEDKQ